MEISRIGATSSFGRAFTTKEKQEWKQLEQQSRKELGLGRTTAVVFDFNIPSEQGYNTAIGTTLSEKSQGFMNFVQDMTGANAMLLGPQGQISSFNICPYSGTTFSLGEHLIDLKLLSQDDYENILPLERVQQYDNEYDGDKWRRDKKVDYGYVIGDNYDPGVQNLALKEAFENFQQLPKNSKLKKEFNQFKKDNTYWLEKDALYDALATEHGVTDSTKWPERDRDLFSGKYSKEDVNKRVSELKDKYSDLIESKEFNQFLIDKQQQAAKKQYNDKGFKTYGDCLVGFSDKERWAHKSCFKENEYMGCKNPGEALQTWGFPALDYSKLGTPDHLGETGELIAHKFDIFFKRYDGFRIDAAWQIINPYTYAMDGNNPREIGEQPKLNDSVIKIMENSARKAGKLDKDSLLFELLGQRAKEGIAITQGKYPHIHITRYAHGSWGRPAFYEQKQGYKPGDYTIGIGTHDDITLRELASNKEERQKQSEFLAQDLKLNRHELVGSEEKFRNAKTAELFTTKDQFFTLPDMFGMSEKINQPGTPNGLDTNNWTVRIPTNYEAYYYQQLSDGLGMNMPDARATALKAKNSHNHELINKLQTAAAILREKGPNTQAEADAQYGANFSKLS